MWAAFLLGFLGSLHCVGMCGPLAIVIHQQAIQNHRRAWTSVFLYHAGRISIYIILGMAIGLISSVLWGTLQFYLSLLAAAVLILSAFSLVHWEKHLWSLPGLRTIGQWIPKTFGRLMQHSSPLAPLLGGMINGLLPCGLVYLMLSTALTTGDTWISAQMMLFFGIGTIPALAFTQYAGWKARLKLSAVRTYILPAFLFLTGVFLILRAFAVPIPVDLRLLQQMTNIPMCH